MTEEKIIKAFYRVYKDLHKKLEESIEDIRNEYIAARVLDKVIIFYFIKENMMKTYEKKKIDKLIKKEIMKYDCVIDFYKNPLKFLDEDIINPLLIINLFNDFAEYDNYKINNEIISECFKKLSKYEWSFKEDKKDVVTPDLLGIVFEKYINQKETGSYYTDIDTIKYINRNSIVYALMNNNMKKILKDTNYSLLNCEELIRDNKNLVNEFNKYINNIDNIDILRDIKSILHEFTVIDITVGTGAFILDAIDMLEELHIIINNRIADLGYSNDNGSRVNLLISIIEKNIYGVDIMEDAIEMAKFRVLLKIIAASVYENTYTKGKIRFNLKVGNTLIGSINNDTNLLDHFADTNKFDWNKVFKSVIESGGFDCIIGNPPYIEYTKVMEKYKINGFKSIKCGNIYAFVIERAIKLLKKDGVLGLIVPISLISTNRMKSIRDILESECSILFYSNYGDRPGTLFNGVHQKLTILIGKKNENYNKKIYTSMYYHWYKEERRELFSNIRYILNEYRDDRFYYKVGNLWQKNVIDKINSKKVPISNIISKIDTENNVYLSGRLTFWVKSFLNPKKSSEFKSISFESKEKALVFNAVINSSLYYFWWETVSDCWHLTKKELELFYFDFNSLTEEQKNRLINLSYELEESLENNKKFIGSKQTKYEYKHKMSKCIIDEIDCVLADYYGLTSEEYENIICYNLPYRMNDELENYLTRRESLRSSKI